MKKILKTLILEFKERSLPKPIYRQIRPPEFKKARKAWVLMGMRRSGKTWVAYQHIQNRLEQGFPNESNLYLNFEDERLENFNASDFQLILDAYFELYPQNLGSKELFFCFDEIQVIEGWEKFVRRLLDTENMQICVTGSSAEMLSRELSSTLGGRAWPQEVFPFSWSEFLQYKGLNPEEEVTPKKAIQMRHLLNDYLIFGGFPEVICESQELHATLVQGYMDAVVLRDIVKRHNIPNVVVLQKFLNRILRQLATPLSISKVYNTMKSMGLTIGKNTLFDYVQYFEDAYAFLSIPIFTLSESMRQVNPKKIYAVDSGIITAYSIKNGLEKAARLENAVFMHLRRHYKDICYYKSAKHREVDFIITKPNDDLLMIQSCVELSDQDTRNREILGLVDACQEFEQKEGFIITEDHEEEIEYDSIHIHCIPFWKWAKSSL